MCTWFSNFTKGLKSCISKAYNPKSERGVRWNDSNFKIKWPLKPTEISKKDLSWNDYDYYK